MPLTFMPFKIEEKGAEEIKDWGYGTEVCISNYFYLSKFSAIPYFSY